MKNNNLKMIRWYIFLKSKNKIGISYDVETFKINKRSEN